MEIVQESRDPFRLSYRPGDGDRNVNGDVHGGILYYVCDEAIGRYVTAMGRTGAAADGAIHYYRPAHAHEKFTVTVSERKIGRKLGVFLVEAKNEQDRLIADAMFTVAFSDRKEE